MAFNANKRVHRIPEKDISNQVLMRMSNISANIITKLRTGQHLSPAKAAGLRTALHCTPNDMWEFTAKDDQND